MQRTRDNSRFVVVCQYTDAGTVEVTPHWNTNRKHLEIRGCWGNDFSHFYRGVKVLAKHGERFTSHSWTANTAWKRPNRLWLTWKNQVIKAVIEP
jgi:hypothetical protein